MSWGQRACAGDDKGQKGIESKARCIAWLVMLMNVGFACGMTAVKLAYPNAMIYVANLIMSVAGCTFVISALSYIYMYWCGFYNLFFSDREHGIGLNDEDDRAFALRRQNTARTSSDYRETFTANEPAPSALRRLLSVALNSAGDMAGGSPRLREGLLSAQAPAQLEPEPEFGGAL